MTQYDADLLARARGYEHVPIEGALWSLQRAVNDSNEVMDLAVNKGILLLHPERGELTSLDIARTNAHDADHHGWDIERSIE